MEQETLTLVERLERLERENSRIKRSARLTKIGLAMMGALFAGVATVPLAHSLGPPSGSSLINAQKINLVNGSGRILATLGTNADGNNLTFFDSSGKKTVEIGNSADGTFTGLVTFDGNSIFPGTGQYRTTVGEANTSNVNGGGLGFGIYNAAGKIRKAGGTSVDDTLSYLDTIDPNGSATGIIDENTVAFQNQGFFANDLNGKNRIFAGNSLDGTSYNEVVLANSAGQLRAGLFNTPTNGDGFDTFGANGNPRTALFTSTDDSFSGYMVWDGTSLFGTQRLVAGLGTSGSTVQTFDASHTQTGHMP